MTIAIAPGHGQIAALIMEKVPELRLVKAAYPCPPYLRTSSISSKVAPLVDREEIVGLDGAFAIVLAIILICGMWKLNRHYERSGVIFGVPFSIRRERTPRFFRTTMILNWMVFSLSTLALLGVSVAIIALSD